MNKVAFYPTVFAIIIAVISLGVPMPNSQLGSPWLVAKHVQTMPGGEQVDVDTLVFYLWGHQYTVSGTQMVQSRIVRYDYRDFPFYSMIMSGFAVLIGVSALGAGRKYTKFFRVDKINPLYLLAVATGLMLLSTAYLYIASSTAILPGLINNGYLIQYSYGIQFMALGFVGFFVATVMTMLNKHPEEEDKGDKIKYYG